MESKIILVLAVVLGVALVAWVAYGYFSVQGIEEPKFAVLEKKDGYEIRAYEPYIIAAAEVEGNLDQSLYGAFPIVAGYIFGDNSSQSKIAMTVPVQEAKAEKIAMTAPVLQTTSEGSLRRVSFVMPSKYSMETLPVPNDARVQLIEVPARKVAALRFSWSASEGMVEAKKEELKGKLAADGVVSVGEPEMAFYNPPWTPPFMLRSEVLIPIE